MVKVILSTDRQSAVMELPVPSLQAVVTSRSAPAILQFLNRLRALFSSDVGEAVLEIPFPMQLKVDAPLAADLIETLGRTRAALTPEWPRELSSPPGVPRGAERDYLWTVQSEVYGDVLIHFRDPRYGWLCYVMSKETARQFAEGLIEHSDEPAAQVGRA